MELRSSFHFYRDSFPRGNQPRALSPYRVQASIVTACMRTPGRPAGGRGWRDRARCLSNPDLLPLVLLVQPFLERREVVEDRARVHLPLAGEGVQLLGPGTALPHLEHRLQLSPRGLVVVDRALVERRGEAGLAAERPVELELQDVGQEVTGVRHVRRDVVLGAGIEIGLAAGNGGRDPLVLETQVPPGLV